MVDPIVIESDVDARGRQSVQQLIRDGVCAAVDYRYETASTNDLALQHLRNGGGVPMDGAALFLADHQTGGRGRHGRRWQSSDQTLTFSLVLTSDPTTPAGQMTGLAVGVAVARAIEFDLAPLQTRLKWPNDVYVDGGKAGGILLETVAGIADAVVVGVGINVGSRPDLGNDPRAMDVRDLSSCTGRQLNRYDLLPSLVEQIVTVVGQVDNMGAEVVQDFRRRCLLDRQYVTYQRGTETRHGQCRGIGDTGELLIETADGVEQLTSGEAHLVRIAS